MKKIIAILTSAMLMVTALAGCSEKKVSNVDNSKLLKISAASVGVSNEDKNDDLYKFMSEKFNIDIDMESISRNALAEKTRIMITSGTMPDVMFGNWDYNGYMSFCKQGLLKALPDDYKERYPNIASELERTMILDTLEERGNGKLYSIVRASSFGVIYGQDNDINVGREAFVYRKDWAKQLGIDVKPVMSYDEFYDMAKKFKEADLGKAGKANVMGMAATHDYAALAFLGSNNNNYRNFYKNEDGEYVCGYRDEATLIGVNEYARAYREGILHPNFYAHKSDDIDSYFLTGKTGIYFSGWGSSYPNFKTKFEDANPGLDADECIGLFTLAGKDGVLRTRANTNFYGGVYFNPDIDEEKFERILTMIDWISSEEGTRIINYGLEGKDHKVNDDGSIEILLEKTENGTYPAINSLYNSWNLFETIASVKHFDLNINIEELEELNNMLSSKINAEKNEIEPLDIAMQFYAGDKYKSFMAANDFDSMVTQIIMSDGDVTEKWNKKIDSMKSSIDDVLKEINADLK